MHQNPKLPYSYDQLSPVLSSHVVKTHYEGHTQKYYDAVKKLARDTKYENSTLEEIVTKIDSSSSKLYNNAAQALNHTCMWESMAPSSEGPSKRMRELINSQYGNVETFKDEVINTGVDFFGSGWCWIVLERNAVSIKTTKDGRTLLPSATVLFCIDLWEHAYYLQYTTSKRQYLTQWWNVANWNRANEIVGDIDDNRA